MDTFCGKLGLVVEFKDSVRECKKLQKFVDFLFLQPRFRQTEFGV